MVCDYERAWLEFGEYIAGKPQHGQRDLLTQMVLIAQRSRVQAGELPRLLRLYGVEVERVRAMETETDQAQPEPFVGGCDSPADPALAGHHGPGGHDGGRSGAGNGRRSV